MALMYSAGDAIRLTGCGAKRLHFWTQASGVVPPTQAARGTGTRRLFSFADLVALRLLIRLRAEGFPLALVAPIANHVQQMPLRHAGSLRSIVLWFDGTRVREGASATVALRERPFGIVVRADVVVAELRDLLSAGPRARPRERGFPKGSRARTRT